MFPEPDYHYDITKEDIDKVVSSMTTAEIIYNKNPTADQLRHLLKNDPRIQQKKAYRQAIELKLQALTQEPTTIEKTMTAEQLYNANSPFWTNEYDVYDLECYFEIGSCSTWNQTVKFINHMRSVAPTYNIFGGIHGKEIYANH